MLLLKGHVDGAEPIEWRLRHKYIYLTLLVVIMGKYSTLLFARPSVAEGCGRLVDFFWFLNEYNKSESPEKADHWASWADWCAVGHDINTASLGELKKFMEKQADEQRQAAAK